MQCLNPPLGIERWVIKDDIHTDSPKALREILFALIVMIYKGHQHNKSVVGDKKSKFRLLKLHID